MKSKHIVLMILTVALLFSFPIHGRMFSNSSGGAYEEGDGTGSAGETPESCPGTIENLVIKGAEYFFKAQSDISRIDEKVEISDIYGADLDMLSWALNGALDNINMARYYYSELQSKANNTPYNQAIINKLLTFDYDSFQEEHGLLQDVFSEVKSYLVIGDVRGLYSRTSDYFDTIADILETIKGNLKAGIFPSNSPMWALNQTCTKVHMFGQYAAMIFESIK